MDYPHLPFPSEQAWEAWLQKNGSISQGIWMKLAKKQSGIPSLSYTEALDVALCHGWIDGQKQKLDDLYWLQKFTPRRPRSGWSKVNCGKVEALIAAGRMQPTGFKEIEAAKADGRWDNAYHSQSSAEIPTDFAEALATSPKAKAFFETLKKSDRYPFLYRIQTTKRPENRARKIAEYVAMLESGKTFRLI